MKLVSPNLYPGRQATDRVMGVKSGSFWPGITVGFIVMVLLGSLPVVGPFIGGFIAGLIAKGGFRGGALAGFLSGIFGAVIVTVILLLGGSLLFGIPGFFLALGTSFVLLIASLYFGLIGALGGALAGAFFR